MHAWISSHLQSLDQVSLEGELLGWCSCPNTQSLIAKLCDLPASFFSLQRMPFCVQVFCSETRLQIPFIYLKSIYGDIVDFQCVSFSYTAKWFSLYIYIIFFPLLGYYKSQTCNLLIHPSSPFPFGSHKFLFFVCGSFLLCI